MVGSFEVIGLLGAGGMGEVYRARDTKLNREVALKMLPSELALDADRLARFKREAQVLASLDHQNIGAIYGFEDADGVPALVLQLVEGPTLADRIGQGPIAFDDALPIARQIAEALEAAHERGIIHRDLKPANIKLTPDAKVKVLDFGLAKAVRGETTRVADLTQSPTMTVSGTREGLLLGTAAYMSPEQARGQPVDKRTDIWAFGCVLYEMLTGRAAFPGDTISDTLVAVLEREPDWGALPPGLPPAVRRVLERCLEKDRRQRLHDVADGRIDIELREPATGDAHQQPRRRMGSSLSLAIASMLTLFVILAMVWLNRSSSPSAPPPAEMRVDITTPATGDPESLALSPDGQKIVFVAISEGVPRLWVRSLDSVTARPLLETGQAKYPFWSADSRSVGFFADDKLKRVDVQDGSVRALANAPLGNGGAWNGEGAILFSRAPRYRIFRVGETGGDAVPLTHLEAVPGNHSFPQFLPDGRHFLFFVDADAEARGIYVSGLDGSAPRRLLVADTTAKFSLGHLLFVRQGSLLAQRFDAARLELSGNPFSVAEQIATMGNRGSVALSASAAGPIAYRRGIVSAEQLEWIDRSGTVIGNLPVMGTSPALSPDGHFVAMHRRVNGNIDIWLVETATGRTTRFTSDPGDDTQPTWSPDGRRIAFASSRKGWDLYTKSVDGALGTEEPVFETKQDELIPDWSPDDRFLIFRAHPPAAVISDIWAVPLAGTRKPFPVVETEFDERNAKFSPDSKWIAYQSNESGRYEIYIRPFPNAREKSQFRVSTNGGAQPTWRRDGKELYYVALDDRLMAVPIQVAPNAAAVAAGTPVALFASRIVGGAVQPNPQYTPSPEGKRFLIHTVGEIVNSSPITVILNWKAIS
jgi:serine/threonine protein kinase